MKRCVISLTAVLLCGSLMACTGHQPSGYYGTPFIVKKPAPEKQSQSKAPASVAPESDTHE